MQFGLLGPLRVVDGERVVVLGGPMQRAVLALLILAPNRVVSTDELVRGLWGDDPPARAAADTARTWSARPRNTPAAPTCHQPVIEPADQPVHRRLVVGDPIDVHPVAIR